MTSRSMPASGHEAQAPTIGPSHLLSRVLPSNQTTSHRFMSNRYRSRRIAKLDTYLAQSLRKTSSLNDQRAQAITIDDQPRSPLCEEVRRWDGNMRSSSKWDSIRKDPELWFPEGDCLVHFYERGASKRGASLRVSLFDIQSSNCEPLLERCYSESITSSPLSPNDRRTSAVSETFDNSHEPVCHELHIPAPAHFSREEALQYHLTTRNFFAWLYGRPVVGERLGESLIDLQGRMSQYRPNEEENQDDILVYLDGLGYLDFRECADHALAIIKYAEHYRARDLWTDAYVHCVGMYHRLDESDESEGVSDASTALITRAHTEMEQGLEKAGRSLVNFLDEDLAGSQLGFGEDAQLHLERFRSFLHTYYIGQHNYWPPTAQGTCSDAFPSHVYRAMYFDFRSLYEFLADTTSGTDSRSNRPVDGGICVYQNIMALDQQNRYTSLPHPLPLIPNIATPVQSPRYHGFKQLFGYKQGKLDRRIGAASALAAASNSHDHGITSNKLVDEYLRFERFWTMREDTAISCADGRKVRWILIYAILQTLVAVTRVPHEVQDTEGVSYSLCAQTTGTPPWRVLRVQLQKLDKSSKISRTASLADRIMAAGPDMDILSARPTQPKSSRRRDSSISSSTTITASEVRNAYREEVPLQSPTPIRQPSIDFLPPNENTADGPFIAHTTLQPAVPVSPTISSTTHDINSGSGSGSASNNGSWDSNSNSSVSTYQDTMEHVSVQDSDSDYNDNETEDEGDCKDEGLFFETKSRSKLRSTKMAKSRPLIPEKKKKSIISYPSYHPPNANYQQINPELEQFLTT